MRVSVSNLDYFRSWRKDEEADLDALLRRLRGEEPQTEAMKAGEALHAALENAQLTDGAVELIAPGYRFYLECDATIELPEKREHKIEKSYGDLLVRGRVDGIDQFLRSARVTDYKTTSQFDPDRLLEGFQWRFYLDMTGADWFFWKIFVLKEFGDIPGTDAIHDVSEGCIAPTHTYEITQFHELSQHRYEGMEDDCARLAAAYHEFVQDIGEEKTRRVEYAQNR